MRRLTIAFCLLAQAFAQQELVGKKIADPGAAATADGSAACAAPVYEQAIALPPRRPLFPGGTVASTAHVSALSSLPRRDRRQHWLTSRPPPSLVLDCRKYYIVVLRTPARRRRRHAVDAVIKRETLLYVGSAKSTSGP